MLPDYRIFNDILISYTSVENKWNIKLIFILFCSKPVRN